MGLRSRTISLLIAVAACSGDNLLLPRDGEPARITALPSNMTGTVGQPLEDSLVVEVTDPGGRPVPEVEVTFVPLAGGVVEPAEPVVTNSEGRAAVHYILSTVAGSQMVEARAPIVPADNAVALFAVTANPEPAEALVKDERNGDGQTAQVSTVLPESLAVKAVDRFNNGVAGIEVTWRAEGGQVSPTSVITGADGRAAAARTLGDSPGPYITVARAELDGSPITFNATAIAAPRPQIVIVAQPSTTAAAGVPLAEQPVLQLQDPTGAPLLQDGVSVSVQIAEGGGSLGGRTSVRSDANGSVRFTDLELRGEIGTRTLIFAADGFTPVTSAAIVVQPGAPSDESSVSVGNGTAGVTTPISVALRDEFGNAIAGAGGDLSLRVAGANPATGLSVTDNGNGSYSSSYIPVRSGTDEIILEYRGDRLGESQSTVSPGPTNPSTSTAEVTRAGVFFVRIDVLVTVRDAQGNVVGHGGDLVQISANGSAPRSCAPPDGRDDTCLDNGDGTYTDAFILIADDVTVDISVNGVPISGSPFHRPAD